MGSFRVPMRVTNPLSGAIAEVEAVVDTGATLTALPPSVVRQLGLQQEDTRTVKLADGTVRQLSVGAARFTVQGRSATTPVLFSTSDEAPALLGSVTLESMGFGVDPIGQRLLPQELLLLALVQLGSWVPWEPARSGSADGAD